MITTVHVSISWPRIGTDRSFRVEGGPALFKDPVQRLKINDPRVLLGAQQVLVKRTGVTQADLVSAIGIPYFAVSVDDQMSGSFGARTAVTTLLGWLTEPIRFDVAFAADGGWKVVPVELVAEVL